MTAKSNVKWYLWPALIAFAIILLVVIITQITSSKTINVEPVENVNVSHSQIIDNSFFGAGQTVDIAGTINGDLYVAGQTVNISGTINGDILGAGQIVNISGDVAGDIRIAAQSLIVSGTVGKSATIASQTISLEKNSIINNDLIFTADSATLGGYIGRDVSAAGVNLSVTGDIVRDLSGPVSSLTLADNSRVGGSINYISQNDLSRQESAIVDGDIVRQEPEQTKAAASSSDTVANIIYMILSLLVVMLVASLLLPRWLESVTDQALPTPWRALLVGIVSTIVVPFIILLFIITIVGLPLAFIAMLVWLVLLVGGSIAFAYYLGRLIYRGNRTPLTTGLVGGCAAILLLYIPIINILAIIIGGSIGIGAVLLEIKKRRPYYYKIEAKTESDSTKRNRTIKS